MRTSPSRIRMSPAMIRNKVDAPHPAGPTMAVCVDLGNVAVTSRNVAKVTFVSDTSSIDADSFTYSPVRYATCTSRVRSRTFWIHGAQVSIRARRTPFKLRKLLVIDDDATLVA